MQNKQCSQKTLIVSSFPLSILKLNLYSPWNNSSCRCVCRWKSESHSQDFISPKAICIIFLRKPLNAFKQPKKWLYRLWNYLNKWKKQKTWKRTNQNGSSAAHANCYKEKKTKNGVMIHLAHCFIRCSLRVTLQRSKRASAASSLLTNNWKWQTGHRSNVGYCICIYVSNQYWKRIQ